ncbi:sensor histidine kinase [uncultured Sunxiuqinia sp.]|uniref:sensor histidine kinase n=1 Tax=uncultured Sunxiuqinia sp. TaxID=1573825 RepID=UPI002AA62C0C|nr:sensor histidine kinase [uncultured Sunxiuqinia sp.]
MKIRKPTQGSKIYFFKRFAIVSLLFIAISSLVFWVGFQVMLAERRMELKTSQKQKVLAEKSLMEHLLDEAVLDLMIMSDSRLFQSFFISKVDDSNQRNNFNDLVKKLFRLKSAYYQLRHLDLDGMETFRIERRNGKPYICTPDELQNKSHRYYFTNSLDLEANEYYVSPLDLNIEHGEIEQPYRPMIRICVPVFDPLGKKIGINVLNFDASGIIHKLDVVSDSISGINFLINDQGYFLNAKDSALEWGFMFPEKNNLAIDHVLQEDAEVVRSTENGQFEGIYGLYTVETIDPFVKLGDRDFATKQKDRYRWKVISFVDSSHLGLSSFLPLASILGLYSIVILVGMLFGYFYARIAFRKYQSQVALIDSERDLRIANQSKNQFFSIISHDLKNASGVIANYLEFMQETYDDFSEEERKSHIKDIGFAARQHNKLLYDILDWARIQMGKVVVKPETIWVDKLIEEQIKLVEISLKNKGLRIEAELKEDLRICGDKEMIKTIFRNLISNAIKFSNRDNSIRIEVKDLEDRIELQIIDFGLGMREFDAEKILDLSSKIQQPGTENESGTGFGLKLVAELVQKNKGTIRVESELGKGSSFILNFPSGK